jgi:phage head maturation protease
MRLFFPITKVDAEQRMVWGYASTEARDDQGEIVTRSALEAALGDYMKFANVREMHQLSAVGVAKEAAIDDKGLYVGAKIVDPLAWEKVVAGVYKGFSIGGRATGRASGDPNTITALVLNEISLVDRPANPEAVFDCWKAATGEEENPDFCTSYLGSSNLTEAGRKLGALAQPIQVWVCGEAAHRHLAKADAVHCIERRGRVATVADEPGDRRTFQPSATSDPAVAVSPGDDGSIEYADPGYQPDGKKRYPLDTQEHIRAAWAYISRSEDASRYTPAQLARIKFRIIARWKERIDRAGPPAAREPKASRGDTPRKAVFDAGRVASIICELGWLQGALAVEETIEGAGGPQPAQLIAIIDELCDLLGAMATLEAAEPGTQEREFSPIATALAQRDPAMGPDPQSGLAKMLVQQRAEKAALLRTLAEIGPRLDALSKRVDDISRQPLPPVTIAKPVIAVSKRGDDFPPDAALDPGAIAAALGRMSKEDQALTLIKAARLNPIRRSGSAAAPPPQS